MSFVASAPGKLILFGEHAVVHGEPAIATALSLRTFCQVEEDLQLPKDSVELLLKSFGEPLKFSLSLSQLCKDFDQQFSIVPLDQSEELLAALEKTAECANPEAPKDRLKGVMAFILLLLLSGLHKSGTSSLRFTVWSDIPVGAGLGSSAAYCASVCGALTRAAKVVPCGGGKQEGFCEPYCDTCKEKLNLWTYEGERVLHGNPSGIDNSIAIYGGALSFVRGKEQGKGITHIRMPVVPMVLTDTGVPRSTQKLVAGVGERKKEFPEVMGHVLNAMGEVSKKCMDLFENEKDQSALIAALNALIDINQGLLECCGVSHESIRSVKRVAQELGYHTKLTGAGGGGCTFTLVKNEENKSKLEQAIAKLGMRYFEVNIGGEGLSIKLLL